MYAIYTYTYMWILFPTVIYNITVFEQVEKTLTLQNMFKGH